MAADKTITDLTALEEALAAGDLFECVNVSVTTDSTAGSSRKATASQVATYLVGAGFVTGSGAAIPATFDPTTHAWNTWWKADAITPQSDGSNLASWSDSGPNGKTLSQSGSGAVQYRTAANGLNGLPGVKLTGTGYARATTGGAALSGSWWAGVVFRVDTPANAVHQVMCWGDDATAKRRALIKREPGYLEFNGQGADFHDTAVQPIAVMGTAYLLEFVYDSSSGTLYQYVNGALVKQGSPSSSFQAYTGTAITLGANNASTENAKVTVFEAWTDAGVPSSATQLGMRSYLAGKWGFSLPSTAPGVGQHSKYSAAGVLAAAGVSEPVAGLGVVGAGFPGKAVDKGFSSAPPAWSVYGAVWADSGTNAEHCFIGGADGQNVGHVQHKLQGNTYSAWAFNDCFGDEKFAVGFGNVGPFGTVFSGCAFVEASDFNNPANAPPPLRIVTTGTIGGTNSNYVRLSFNPDGSLTFYDLTPGVGATGPIYTPNALDQFKLYPTGDVVYGNAALATTATAGFPYLPSCAGAPTGAPAGYSGRVPIIVDTTNNKIWVRIGGTWKGVTVA